MEKVLNSLENAFGKEARVDGNIAKINIKKLDGFGLKRLNNFNADRFKGVVEKIEIKPSNGGLAIWITTKEK